MKYAALITGLLLIGGGCYYHFLYPPALKERAAEKAMRNLAQIVATNDRAQVSEALRNYFTDDAKIHLSVGFFSMTQATKMNDQDFDRESFISFIDNVLYSLSAYGYESRLDQFRYLPQTDEAGTLWKATAWGDGLSYYDGVGVAMRYSADPECSGKITFKEGEPKLEQAACTLVVRTVPKPGEEQKLQQNPGALGDYLR